MRKYICIGLLCSLTFTFGQSDYKKLLVPSELKKDLTILKENLEQVHPGLYAYYSKEKFDAFYETLSTKINKPLTSVDFYRNLLPLLSLIANNHTKIECPLSYEKALFEELPKIPFRLYPQNGKLYMHIDLSDEQSITPGSEILSINGVSSSKIISEMIRFDTKDGFNTSHSVYAIGVVFSKRYGYYFGTSEKYEITFRTNGGKTRTEVIRGMKAIDLNARMQKSKTTSKSKKDLTFSINDDIAYLKIPSFQPKNSSSFKKTLRVIFQELSSKNVQDLIVDVRGNGGGYGEAVSALFSYFIKESIFPYKDEYALVNKIPQPQFYEKDMFFKHFKKQPLEKRGIYYHIKNIASKKINPKNPVYKNNIYILLDAASASATGEFLGLAKSYTDAVFIGQESGGNPAETTANDLLHMTLPNSKVRVTIPALRSVGNVTFENNGRGLIPDYEIIPTIVDILENKDVALEFTFKKIKKHQERE